MTVGQGRAALLTIFFAGLAAQIVAAAFVPFNQGTIRSDDVSAIAAKLIFVYSVHFAVMFGSIFARGQHARSPVPKAPLLIALVVTLGWNMLLVRHSIAFAASAFDQSDTQTVGQLIAELDATAEHGSFLVVGALAFFFSKES